MPDSSTDGPYKSDTAQGRKYHYENMKLYEDLIPVILSYEVTEDKVDDYPSFPKLKYLITVTDACVAGGFDRIKPTDGTVN